jgi:hypothetical protein
MNHYSVFFSFFRFGEESGLKEPSDYEYIWVLDPIDGTKSFITGLDLFYMEFSHIPFWSYSTQLLWKFQSL